MVRDGGGVEVELQPLPPTLAVVAPLAESDEKKRMCVSRLECPMGMKTQDVRSHRPESLVVV